MRDYHDVCFDENQNIDNLVLLLAFINNNKYEACSKVISNSVGTEQKYEKLFTLFDRIIHYRFDSFNDERLVPHLHDLFACSEFMGDSIKDFQGEHEYSIKLENLIFQTSYERSADESKAGSDFKSFSVGLFKNVTQNGKPKIWDMDFSVPTLKKFDIALLLKEINLSSLTQKELKKNPMVKLTPPSICIKFQLKDDIRGYSKVDDIKLINIFISFKVDIYENFENPTLFTVSCIDKLNHILLESHDKFKTIPTYYQLGYEFLNKWNLIGVDNMHSAALEELYSKKLYVKKNASLEDFREKITYILNNIKNPSTKLFYNIITEFTSKYKISNSSLKHENASKLEEKELLPTTNIWGDTIFLRELKTKLFNFQVETLLWCLDKENVNFDFKANTVSNRPFFDVTLFKKPMAKYHKSKNEKRFLYNYNYLAKKLDKVVFGWVRLTTNLTYIDKTIKKETSNIDMFFEELQPDDVFWYNKFTGCIISTNYLLDELKDNYTTVLKDIAHSRTNPRIKQLKDVYKRSAYFAQNLLSEEMGLGKTVELVALILANQRKDFQQIEVTKNVYASFIHEDNFIYHEVLKKPVLKAKTTLIVCPDPILNQWIREITKFAPHLKILRYNGFSSFQNEVLRNPKRKNKKDCKRFIITLKFDPEKSEKFSRNFSKRSEILLNFSTFNDNSVEMSTKFSPIINFDNRNDLDTLKFKSLPNVSVNNITINGENFAVPVIGGNNVNYMIDELDDSFDLVSDNYSRMFNKPNDLRLSEAHKKIAFELSQYDIIVTSYRVAAKEFYHAKYNTSDRPERVSRKRKFHFLEQNKKEELIDYTSPLTHLQYWRVILDEVQMATTSNAAKTCKMFARCHAWGISGTPIKRELNDIMGQLSFLNILPFAVENEINKNNFSKLINIHPKNYSWNAVLNQTISIDFLKIFTNLAIRHDKSLVKEDIHLPKQKRILLTSTFSPIELDNYKIIFEKFLYECGLNVKGEPVVNDWSPDISLMRKYLMILRKMCSYIGLANNLNNGTSVVTSVSIDKAKEVYSTVSMDDILDMFLAETRTTINDLDKEYVNLFIELAEIEELLHNPYEFKIKLLDKVEFVKSKINYLKKEINNNYNKAQPSELEEHQVKFDSINIDLNDEFETDETVSMLRGRLKSWLEMLHKLYFFIANSNYQISLNLLNHVKVEHSLLECELGLRYNRIGTLSNISEVHDLNLLGDDIPEERALQLYYNIKLLECKYYKMAELIRYDMLKSFLHRYHEVLKLFYSEYPQKSRAFVEVKINDFQQKSFKSIKTREIKIWYFKLFKVIEEYLFLTEISNEWLTMVNRILLSSISDSDMDETIYLTVNSSDAEEYEKSIINQEKAFYILSILEVVFKFHEAIIFGLNSSFLNGTGAFSSKNFNDLLVDTILEKPMYDENEIDLNSKAKAQRKKGKTRMKNNENSDESIELETFKNRLKLKMRKIKPIICQEGGSNLEYNLVNLIEQGNELGFLKIDLAERETFKNTIKRLIIFRQEKSAEFPELSKKYYHSLNVLYNSRSNYYKQLQNISDEVKSTDFNKYTNVVNRNRVFQYQIDNFIKLTEEQKLEFLRFVREKIITNIIQQNRARISKFNSRCLYLESLKDSNNGEEKQERICIICQSSIVTGVLTECGHHYCKNCLGSWITKTKHNFCPLCKSKVSKNSVYEFTFTKQNLEVGLISSDAARDKLEDKPNDRYLFYSKLDDNEFKNIEKQKTRFKNKYGAKIESLIKLLLWLKLKDDSVQIVIFSQWADFLAIAACALRENGIKTIGGGVKTKRIGSDEVNKFKYDSSITCFLLHAQQQAAGLTLVNATHVILCEPLINTALELQAINRIHRIGQRYETTVWMLGIQGTIEELIINFCTAKRIEQLNHLKQHQNNEDNISKHLAEFSEFSIGQTEEFQRENTQVVIDSMDLMKETGKLISSKEGELVSVDDLWKSFFSNSN